MAWKPLWNPSVILKFIKNTFFRHGEIKKYSIGFLFAILAAILGAIADVLPKFILEEDSVIGLNPIVMISVMYLINGIIFTGISPKRNPINEVGKRNFLFLIIIGASEITATGTYYFGLKDTSASNAAILGNSDIIFTSIIATIVFREIIRRNEYFPYCLIVLGSVTIPIWLDLIVNDYQITKLVFGDILILLAGLFYGLEMNLYRYLSDRINSRRILQIVSLTGGVVSLSVVILFQIPINLNLENIPIILISGIFGIGISVLFIVIATKYIGAIRTILIFSTTTLFGILFSFIILGEEINSLHFVAFVMVFLGVVFLRTKISTE